jgi:hypothetical protein
MTYTQIALVGICLTVLIDLYLLRTELVKRKIFWVSYAIIVFFQLVTNGLLTGFRMVKYNGDAIIGSSSTDEKVPAFIGDGRIAFAPVEDLMFGFSLILLTLAMWVWLGRRGIQSTPMAGPPRKIVARFFRK